MKTYKSNISSFKIVKEKTDFAKVKITDSKTAYDFISQFYSSDIAVYESFYLLLLNRANITTGYVKISQGGTVGTVVDTKIIAKYAVKSLSAGVILAHNHPSGSMVPSQPDKLITEKIKNGLALFDIQVLDHIILSGDSEGGVRYYSFADNGTL